MPEKTVALSAKNIANTKFVAGEKDFKFIVGGNEYLTSRFLAAFVSPYASRAMVSDPCLNEFHVDLDDTKNEFALVLSLCYGDRTTFLSRECEYFMRVGDALGNQELFDIAFSSEFSEATVDNIISILNAFPCHSHHYDDFVAFAASNFEELTDIKNLDAFRLIDVLQNQHLVISDEDSLFNTIISFIHKYEDLKSSILSCIRIENLSSLYVTKFVSLIDMTNITEDLLTSIKRRLVLPLSKEPEYLTFRYDPFNPLKGIFEFLENETKGNIVDNGTIEISGSEEVRNKKYMVDSTTNDVDCFVRESHGNPRFITFDLKDKKVNLTSYTIKTFLGGRNDFHLRTWKIRGSNDWNQWEDLDQRIDDNSLNSSYATHNFQCNVRGEKSYRLIQIYSESPDWHGSNFINLSRFELFGHLVLK